MPNPEPARFRRAYRVVSNVPTAEYQAMMGSRPGDSAWSEEVWQHYTKLPTDDRYHRLAAEIQSSLKAEYASDPLALAFTVKSYLEKEATYSFKRSYDGAEDPTADFLFSQDKKGYCVHLAHSAAYLLRSLGVPARVSAGYAVPAKNLAGGSALLIKTGDAHAWAEIYLEGRGWIPIEVTPEKTDIQPSQFQEKDLQQLLGEMARKEGREERFSYAGPRLGDLLRKIAGWLPYLMIGLIALAYILKFWRLLSPALSSKRALPRIAYRAALDRLSAVGLLRERGEPRERFAKRSGDSAPSMAPLTAVHVGSALGSREPMKPAQGTSLSSLSWKVGKEVRRSVPWWRWTLGMINPISWWWSR